MSAEAFFPAISAWLWEWRLPLGLALLVTFVLQIRAARPAERLFAGVMLAYFFLIVVAFWLLKPIKKAAFVAWYKTHPGSLFGVSLEPAQLELAAKELNIAVALVAALSLAWLSRRRTGVGYGLTVTAVYVVALAVFRIGLPDPGEAFVWAFYLFGDVFVTTLVAVFFSFLHEHSDVPGARRIYGLVGLGGVLGGVVGSTTASGLGNALGAVGAIDLCIGLLLAVGLMQVVAGRFRPQDPRLQYFPSAALPPPETLWQAVSHGARLVVHSRHLKLVAAILFCYELSSVIMDYQFTTMVTAALEPSAYRTYFGSVFAFSNALALLVQLLLTTWVLRRHGPPLALLVMPLAVLAGSGLFLAFPVLLFGSLLNTADSAFAYSIQQTARESAYVPLSRQEQYEAKAFIDVVWLRMSKGVAVLISLGASLLLHADRVAWLSLIVIAFALAWLTLVRRLSHSFSALAGQPTRPPASDPATERS